VYQQQEQQQQQQQDAENPFLDPPFSRIKRRQFFNSISSSFRNVSSAGDFGRKKLRDCDGLVDSLLYLVRKAIAKANIDNKSVENCICVLRNLSYRAQEVDDPNYDKRQATSTSLPIGESRAGAKPTSDNLGCFGASKAKRKDSVNAGGGGGAAPVSSRGPRTGPFKGMDLLWQPEVGFLTRQKGRH
jgi:hypothetical protein